MKITEFETIKKFDSHISDSNTNDVRFLELAWLMTHLGDWGFNLEFGVFSGDTINHMAKLRPDLCFVGFDSFQGLPEDWDTGKKFIPGKRFDRKGLLPQVEQNVKLIKGWFNDTVPDWTNNQNNRENFSQISFLNLDADIYSSTKTILDSLNHLIVPGTIIRFDELCCWRSEFNEESPKNVKRVFYTTWKEHEWKALNEWLEKHARVVIPVCRNWFQSATVLVTQ